MSDIRPCPEDDDVSMWIIFEEPPAFPNQYVARRYCSYMETGEFFVGNTLDDVRSMLPPGLIRLERSNHDDPTVRESWL
jgi:hypothetical protein